jgi:uncharacterized protein (TIGR00251 family)
VSVFAAHADGVSIVVKVKAASKKDAIVLAPEWLRVDVRAPAVDGKANAAVLALIAARVGCAKAAVGLLRGERDTRKVVLVRGATLASVRTAFE